jgi:hypothetical protein
MAIGVQDYLRRRWRIAPTSDELLAELPDTFRYSEALERISERQLRRLLSDGQITALARGLYRKRDWLGDDQPVSATLRWPFPSPHESWHPSRTTRHLGA